MRFLLVSLFACMISVSAFAEPVHLSMHQALDLLSGLNALDGYDKVVKEGATEKVVKVPYNFVGGIRLAIGRDIMQLRPAIQNLQQTQQTMRTQFIQQGKLKSDENTGPGTDEFNQQTLEMLKQTQDFDLIKIKSLDLKLDENPIPASILALIQPILDDK